MNYLKAIRENPIKASNTHDLSKTIYGVWSPLDGTVFAVAESGTIFFFDGSRINTFQLDSGFDFYDVFGFSTDDVLAVGTFGSVFRFDGNSWKKIECPTTEWLEGVWGFSPSDFFISGDEGTVLHYKDAEWTSVKTGIKNRLYSIAGLDDGTVYVTGSFGTILKIKDNKSERILTNSEAHLLGIQRLPGTDRFIVCGSGGALFALEHDRIEPIASGVYSSLYGLDAIDAKNIVIVGWKGVALHYDGQKVTRKDLGKNSFMEGVVHTGDGRYLAGGWYGRIMAYSPGEHYWQILQTGRAELTLAVALDGNNNVLSTTDTGNICYIHSGSGKKHIAFAPPVDLPVCAYVPDKGFFVGGKKGYFASIEAGEEGIRLTPRDIGSRRNVLCFATFDNDTWFGGQDGLLFRIADDNMILHEKFKEIVRARDVYGCAFFNEDTIYILGFRGSLKRIDLDTGTISDDKPEGKIRSLFGRNGKVYCISEDKLYELDQPGNWNHIYPSISDSFPSAEELPYTGMASESGEIWIGGDKGGIIRIHRDGTVKTTHSGAFRTVTAIDGAGDIFAAGTRGGRTLTGSSERAERSDFSVSGPAYHSVSALGNNFVFCGEHSLIGFHDPITEKTGLTTSASGDFLTSLQSEDSVLCGGIGGIMKVKPDGTISGYPLPGHIITSMAEDDKKLYLGTSKGALLRMDKNLPETLPAGPLNFEKVLDRLGSIPVEIALHGRKIRIVLSDGRVIDSSDQNKPLFHFTEQALTSPAIPGNTTDFYVAGSENFLCHINRHKLAIFEPPEKIFTVTLHGAIGLGDYWFGGSSGTLLFRANNRWYKVHTGIGNRLHSIAYSGEKICVCGTYGAVRIDSSEFIEEEIGIPETIRIAADTGTILVPEPELILPLPHRNPSFFMQAEA